MHIIIVLITSVGNLRDYIITNFHFICVILNYYPIARKRRFGQKGEPNRFRRRSVVPWKGKWFVDFFPVAFLLAVSSHVYYAGYPPIEKSALSRYTKATQRSLCSRIHSYLFLRTRRNCAVKNWPTFYLYNMYTYVLYNKLYACVCVCVCSVNGKFY